ncbi:hypothetical protein EYB45_01200 [Erythrobacteraceae bacterium CFH 75059]|uniref:hypothetical protein n=1 Tax=Qipengyuania thermophila TaxID=2509361 RepID=UPI0010220C79|nr:hypothetical protein [Qipengyuania thermophila]TCD06377.1 hypothetical protein EYB45_01200 [Erythrobacteraceae bacterium CFH 75059]
MIEWVEANWLLVVLAVLFAVAIAWYIFNARRRTRVVSDSTDVLDEGAPPARRNQALLDAPPLAVPGTGPPAAGDPAGSPAVQRDLRTPGEAAAQAASAPSGDPSDEVAGRGTASPPLPGALGGADVAITAAGGASAAIARAEQAEREEFGAAPTDPDEPSGLPPESSAAETLAEAVSLVEPPASPLPDGGELTRLKGIGPKLALRLEELGITRIEQIAQWTPEEAERIDAQLGRFQGRIHRDGWIEQARLLSSGDAAGYEARFGRL